MDKKLLIVADVGCLKIYRLSYNGINSSPNFELIESLHTHAPGRVGQNLSDEAGRFEGGNPMQPGIRSYGERHNIQLELTRRCIKSIAETIDSRIQKEPDIRECYFAASKETHRQILEHLNRHSREKISRVIPEDLTRMHQSKLLEHFDHVRA